MSGYTTQTAPKRVWLQVNPSARVDAQTGGVEGDDDPFPGEDVTWCGHSIGGLEVEYVRADLAGGAPSEAEDAIVRSTGQAAAGTMSTHDTPLGEYEKLIQLLREVVKLPEVAEKLASLDRGIGTATRDVIWLQVRDAIHNAGKDLRS